MLVHSPTFARSGALGWGTRAFWLGTADFYGMTNRITDDATAKAGTNTGILHSATDGESVRCFGRDDVVSMGGAVCTLRVLWLLYGCGVYLGEFDAGVFEFVLDFGDVGWIGVGGQGVGVLGHGALPLGYGQS